MVQAQNSQDQIALREQLFETLQQEFTELHDGVAEEAGAAAGDIGTKLERLYRRIHALPEKRAALCLSGGGIRSASFALGVLQGLARQGLLDRFHYLSTVSGGGYIGGFLSAWRHHQNNDAKVFAELSHRRSTGYSIYPSDDLFAEPKELQGVRANSNFLTPRLGALSGDTLTVLALYLRNLWLNWLIFLPLFLAGILVPQFCFDFLWWAQQANARQARWLLLAAAVCLGLTACVSAASRPARDITASGQFKSRKLRISNVTWLVIPTFLTGSLLALYRAHLPSLDGHVRSDTLGWGAAGGASIYLVAWLIGFLISARDRHLGSLRSVLNNRVPPFQELLCWTAAGAAAGLFIALGGELFGVMSRLADDPTAPRALRWLVIENKRLFLLAAAGVAWVMLAILTADLIFTGLTSYMKNGDADREWSGRAAGFLAGSAIGWMVFTGVVLYGPPGFDQLFNKWILAAGGSVSGIATLALGSSAKTAATTARKIAGKLSLEQLLSVVTAIFVVFLGILLSKLARGGLDAFEGYLLIENSWHKALVAFAACLAWGGVAWLASYFINVNRFSLHAVYRNRLIRAFLGSARTNATPARDPDPFSGFDQQDNIRVAALCTGKPNEGRSRRLFPVVNTALNIVDGDNLAWQERMAESFAITPLKCGNPIVGFAPTSSYGDPEGISLGTAMAISGAAVSPNQGYHSSRIVGLLMMLFNVRLGWWLGNPRYESLWRKDGPTVSIQPIINELFGRTRDDGSYIYLSDGGHFENLGIYEMIRRRCHYIIVSDAGCDPDCALEDLGNAVRKVWIDFGVKIEFKNVEIAARREPPAGAGTYCALGRICYPESVEGDPGYIIYVKPSYLGTEPPDIRSYAAAHRTFPHETTADQWFTESQMESYRALGSHVIDQLCRGDATDVSSCASIPALGEIQHFITQVQAYLNRLRRPSPDARSATSSVP